MTELKNTFITLSKGNIELYGGDQGSSSSRAMRRCGCGVVAVLNTLLYLHINYPKYRCSFFDSCAAAEMSLEVFECYAAKLRQYLPLFYPFGINGFMLTLGINLFMLKNKIPLRCRWGVRKRKLFSAIGEILEKDIPVILSVGPNFPFLLGNKKLRFYTKLRNGSYNLSASTCAHYVTVTGMDELWLRISSWGKEYFISREELFEYSRRYSCNLLTNIVYMTEKLK